MKFIRKWFAKKEDVQKVTVRMKSLSKWIDLQFKSELEPILLRLETNVHALIVYKNDLQKKLDTFVQQGVPHTNDHTTKQLQDYKRRFAVLVEELIATIDVSIKPTTLQDMKSLYTTIRSQLEAIEKKQPLFEHVLYKFHKKSFTDVLHNIQKIRQNVSQYRDIIEVRVVDEYVVLKEQVQLYFQKELEKETLVEKRNDALKQLDEQQIILHKFESKKEHILQDPKYAIEKERKKKGESAFEVSYYELELKDIQGRIDVQEKKISLLETEIRNINAHIKQLRLTEHIHQLQKYILTYTKLEVEILV